MMPCRRLPAETCAPLGGIVPGIVFIRFCSLPPSPPVSLRSAICVWVCISNKCKGSTSQQPCQALMG